MRLEKPVYSFFNISISRRYILSKAWNIRGNAAGNSVNRLNSYVLS